MFVTVLIENENRQDSKNDAVATTLLEKKYPCKSKTIFGPKQRKSPW